MVYYASFQGRVYLAERDAFGNPINTRMPGNVASLTISLDTDVIEHFESMSGQRAVDLLLVKQKKANVSLVIEEFTEENLALALYGSAIFSAGGTVTAETVGGASPVVGERYFLAHQKISNLTLQDSASSPTTLTDGVHYTVDLDFGAVVFLDLTGLTPPFKANYSYGAVDEVSIFTQPIPERYLRFEGVNTATGNTKTLVELYRVAFSPAKQIDFITDDLAKFELEGSLLADPTKPYNATLGQFGRIVQIG